MKKYLFCLPSILIAINAAADILPSGAVALARAAIVEVGPNHRVWESLIQNTQPDGSSFVTTNRVNEIQTGLYYEENGQWLESQDLVTMYPTGAIAQFGQYKVIFGNSTLDPVDLLTPDGKRFRSHFMALSYFDNSTGRAVLLCEVQDSVGGILPPNQVIYRNAAKGLKVDVRYTYRRDAFHQDVILRENPADPSAYGLNPETTDLEVLTEFVEAPPVQVQGPQITDVSSDEIGFGAMEFGYGKAFLANDSGTGDEIPVARKQWGKVDSRQFLIEKIDYRAIESQLKTLPALDQAGLKDLPAQVALGRRVPAPRFVAKIKEPLKVAAALPAQKGWILDYVFLNSTANFTFAGNETYYVSGAVNLTGRTTWEAGSVIKFTNTPSAQITISGLIDCQATPYRPLILTAKDDNSIGFAIPGSTGTPSGWYGHGLNINSTGNRLDNVRFSYLEYAVSNSPSATQLDMSNVQFVKCRYPLNLQNYSTLNLFNGLFYTSEILVQVPYTATIRGQHWTVDDCATFLQVSPSGTVSTYLTNSLVTALTSWGTIGAPTAFVSSTQLSSASGVFQTVGAAGHYLAANSPYRNAGTVGIGSSLLAEVGKRTTYPPLLHDNSFTVDEVLNLQAQRDSDLLPDVGYHYDPIDWVVHSAVVSANLYLTNGVVLGHYSSYGLFIDAGGRVISEGAPQNLNRIVRYNAVQEQSTNTWAQSAWWGALFSQWSRSDLSIPEVRLRFTDLPSWSGDNHSLFASTPMLWNLTDTQFRGGGTWISSSTASRSIILNATNCLFDRVGQYIGPATSDPITATYRNCLLVNGILNMFNSGSTSGSWSIYDTLFDNVTLTQNGYNINNSNNGYINTAALSPLAGNNQTLATANYQSGPLGRYYLPNNSSRLKAGSRAADAAALYHYTATVDEAKDTTATVDIGFHYVSIDPPAVDSMVTDKSLVGYWKLDETNGTSAGDSSGNAFNGSLTGGASWSSGQVGGGASFDGSSGKISVSNASALQLSGDMTLALWVKKTATPGNWAELVGKANTDTSPGNYRINYELFVEPGTGKRVLFQAINSGTELDLMTKTTLDVGSWYHVAVTIKGSIASIYLNGNLDNTELVPGAPGITTDPVTFGYNAVHNYYQGNLDDVRIYNRALTANEVVSLYAQRGLVGYWKLNEAPPTAPVDSSGNNHTGALIGTGTTSNLAMRGNGFTFDGNGYVTAADAADLRLSGDLTVSCWAKKNVENTGWPRLIGKGPPYGRNYGLWFEPGGKRVLFQRNDVFGTYVNLFGTTVTTVGTWYHIAALIKGGTAYLYINGQLEGSIAAPNSTATSTDALNFAYSDLGFAQISLDDVRIYNRAINVNEIQTLYNQRGLVSHWKMDEGTGTQLADASDNNHMGTLQAAPYTPAWIDGVSGKALSFDGVDDGVTTTESAEQEITGDLTVALWMRKIGTVGNWSRVIGKGPADKLNYVIYTWPGTDNRLEFQQYAASTGWYRGLDTQTKLQLGIWYHVAVVVQGSSAVFYINGAPDGPAVTVAGTPPTTNDPVTLGYDSSHDHYPGDLDDVRIYNRALSASEISALAAQKAADADGDGLPDYWEDKNGNGIQDAGETSMLNSDTDGDGMPDGWEVQFGTNPLVNDSNSDLDGDGLTNYQEFLLGTNPLMVDSDNNGVSDADEDADGDGITNLAEFNPPFQSNPKVRNSMTPSLSDGEYFMTASAGGTASKAKLSSPVTEGSNLRFTLSDTGAQPYDLFYRPSFDPGTYWQVSARGAAGQTNFLIPTPGAIAFFEMGLAVDRDGDGLTDGYEILVTHTCVGASDSDGNGVLDGDEDFDGDELSNRVEFDLKKNPFAADSLLPKKLMIYYAWPSVINGPGIGVGVTNKAVEFAKYSYVVFGEDLQKTNHTDHSKSITIIKSAHKRNPNTKYYGYIRVGTRDPAQTDARMNTYADDWKLMSDAALLTLQANGSTQSITIKGFDGILLDEFEFGYMNDPPTNFMGTWNNTARRTRMNQIIDYAHSKGFHVIVNGYQADDIFAPSHGEVHVNASDYYLHEDHQISAGNYVANPFTNWLQKAEQVAAYQSGTNGIGFKSLSVTTQPETAHVDGWDAAKFSYSWYSALIYGHEATGWGEVKFASTTNDSLNGYAPFRARPPTNDVGTAFLDTLPLYTNHTLTLPNNNYRVTRRTKSGTNTVGTITVDTSDHSAGFTP